MRNPITATLPYNRTHNRKLHVGKKGLKKEGLGKCVPYTKKENKLILPYNQCLAKLSFVRH
jgi:hypothetical protein